MDHLQHFPSNMTTGLMKVMYQITAAASFVDIQKLMSATILLIFPSLLAVLILDQ